MPVDLHNREAGVSPIIDLRRHRIKQARVLPARGDLSVTEVALIVDSSDGGYFALCLKITPERRTRY